MIPLALGVGLADGLARAVLKAGNAASSQAATSPSAADFGAILSDVASSASQAIAGAEKTGVAALQGKASARDVVEKFMHAEQTLQTALAVRDKTVAALQEITRMAI